MQDGNRVAYHPRQSEEDILIDLLSKLNLQQLLPQSTITYQEQEQNTPNYSTINLIFTTERVASKVLIYQLHGTQYGLDYEALETVFLLCISAPPECTHLLFKNTLWAKITKQIEDDLAENKITVMPSDINIFTS